MGYRLGVDLGTTFTSAAVSRNGHVEVVPLGDHSNEIPSAVYLKPAGGYLVGDAAAAKEADQPERVAREFKRRIGDETAIYLGGVPVSAHALTGAVLATVVDLVATREGAPAKEVVVTCPANWGPYRREVFQHALELGGVPGAVLCTEPEAAALHFGTTDRLRDGDVVAVYDLGGGTFDSAVLRREGAELSFVGRPQGIEQLGGLDFDAAVFTYVLSELGLDEGNLLDPHLARGLRRLREGCVRAKERLSHDVETTLDVDLPGAPPVIRLTRPELEELIGPLVVETIDCLERVVNRSGLSPEQLTAVVLVGGSARVPLVRELLTERLGTPLPPSPQPKLCVAMGASIHGAAPLAGPRTPGPSPPPGPDGGVVPPGPPGPDVGRTDQRHRTTTPEGKDNRTRVYATVAALLGLAALLTAFVGHRPTVAEALPVEASEGTVMQEGVGVEVLGISIGEGSIELDNEGEQVFDFSGGEDVKPEFVLAGPAEAMRDAADTLYVVPGSASERLFNGPALAAIAGLLFAFAYGETMLRGVRRRRGYVRASEVLAMTGVGAVLGGVVAVAGWMTGRVPDPRAVTMTVLLLGAAGGAVTFAVAASTAARAAARARSGATTER